MMFALLKLERQTWQSQHVALVLVIRMCRELVTIRKGHQVQVWGIRKGSEGKLHLS